MTLRATLVLTLVVVFIASCVSTPSNAALPQAAPLATQAGAGTSQATTTTSAQEMEGSADAVKPESARTPAALNLDSLRSYLAKTEVRIDTLTPEEALQAWTVVETWTDQASPMKISHIQIVDKTQSEAGERSEVILTENDVFMRTPTDEKWLKFSRSASAMILPGVLTPEEIAASSIDLLGEAAVIATDDDVSGVLTTHYQFTGDALAVIAEQSLPQGSRLVSGQMDLWVAPTGYVKQVIQEFIAEDATGAQTRHSLTMLVLEENLPQGLVLPDVNDVMALDLPEPPTPEPINTETTPESP